MRYFVPFILLLMLNFLFSCEKVIQVDLDEADQKVVIEGFIQEGNSTHRVRVTKTTGFDVTSGAPTIDNATVTVIDNMGVSGVFTSVGNGWYELSGYPGIAGRTYSIQVIAEGNTYNANSTMPNPVVIDSLYAQFFPFGTDTFITVVPAHYDPAGVPNYYQFEIYKNSERVKGIFLQDDQFTDGNLTVQPLFFSDLELQDTLQVTMYCIDQPVWTYFNQLAINASNSTTPANPPSNFSGGCLGYFSARTASTKQAIVN